MGPHRRSPVVLSLLLCACAGDTSNEANTVDAPQSGQSATAPSSPQSATGTPAPERSGPVTLSAAPPQATGGASVTLTLANGSDSQVGYNLCTSALETSAGRPVPTSHACTMELRTLEPGRTETYRYMLPVNMLDGSYRFLTQVEFMGAGRRGGIRSNAIAVRSD